ncbi:MAG: hypothetical protein ACKO40_00515 [Planctomycetaceae bacterium]
MRSSPTVTRSPLPAGRGCVNDIAALALAIPLFPVDRLMRLDAVAAARATARVRIGWAAIFLKAYAIVAREQPPLRSWLAGRFRPRLATSGESVAVLAVNRSDGRDDRLFFARLARPDATPLPLLQAAIDRFATGPVEESYRRQLQLESVPGWLRRTILRWNMRSTSPKRVTRIGTFSLSTLAGFAATNRFHPTICTTSLSYGPLDDDGRCLVTVIADHRVLDGAAVAKALARLEDVLTTQLVAELRTARPVPAEAAA